MSRPLILILNLALVAASACDSSSATGPVLTYGAALDRTGNLGMTSWFDAAALATTHANAGLMKAGKSLQFKLATSDSTNTPTVAVSRSLELVRSQGAKAVITDSSQDDIALNATFYDADPTNDLNVPIVGMTCTAPSINDPNAVNAADPVNQATLRNLQHWNFRTVMNSDRQAAVLTRLAFNKAPGGDLNGDGKFKITFYATGSAGAGTGFAQGVQTALNGLGLAQPPILEQLYQPATLDPNTYDFPADIAKLVDNKNDNTGMVDGYPDVIMVIAFPQYTAAFVKAYVNGGNKIPVLQSHTARFYSTLRAAGSALEGQEGTSPALLDDGVSGDLFASTYLATTGVEPQYLDSNTYDSAMLIMLGSLAATRTLADPTTLSGVQLRDAMLTLQNPSGTVVRTGPDEFAKAVGLLAMGMPIQYLGGSGPLAFDSSGNVIDRIVHWKVVGGKFVDLEKYDCVASADCPLMK